MSSANIAFVRSLYAAFGRGDIATVIGGLTFDVDWNVNGRSQDYPLIGRWKGRDGVQKFFEGVAEHQEAMNFSPREFFAADDRVCVLGHYTWKIRKTGCTAIGHTFSPSAMARSPNSRSSPTRRSLPRRTGTEDRVGWAKSPAAIIVWKGQHAILPTLSHRKELLVHERAAGFFPGVDAALDMAGGGHPRVLGGAHRHGRAFAERTVENDALAG
jgi:uncharacterized protein